MFDTGTGVSRPGASLASAHPGVPACVMHRNVATVVAAGRAAGLVVEPVEFPEGTRTALDAAAAIGVEVGQIVKSLVFAVDGTPVVALVSGANTLDETKLAVAAGGTRATRVDANTVREVTGFPVGGVPPLGHRQALRVFLDRDLLGYDLVWAAAGTPHVNFSASPGALAGATSAIVCDLAVSPTGA